MKILLIDNYDSFTYNLVHLIKMNINCEVIVLYNDKITVSEASKMGISHLIISPGPCDPLRSGATLALIEYFHNKIPIFGVCLGHQAIGEFFGGNIIQAPLPVHGKIDNIKHYGDDMFNHIPSSFKATRYHSLVIKQSTLPQCLIITATSSDHQIMAIRHKGLPIFGVQFHPESIISEFGKQILINFFSSNNPKS
jgi:anthranilate synthase/aminodeoxychorismate synthase-like glutamine amidotransferase